MYKENDIFRLGSVAIGLVEKFFMKLLHVTSWKHRSDFRHVTYRRLSHMRMHESSTGIEISRGPFGSW